MKSFSRSATRICQGKSVKCASNAFFALQKIINNFNFIRYKIFHLEICEKTSKTSKFNM